MAALIDPGVTSHNPHQPAKITWKLNDGQTHELLYETSGIHPPNTWWPDLNFDLSSLFAKQDGLYDKYYRDEIKKTHQHHSDYGVETTISASGPRWKRGRFLYLNNRRGQFEASRSNAMAGSLD